MKKDLIQYSIKKKIRKINMLFNGGHINEEFYEEMLIEYVHTDKESSLEQLFAEKDWENYRTTVHALKSTSMTIGAVTLSEEAKALEMAARDGDEDYIIEHHQPVMEQYRSLLDSLRGALGE